MTDFKVGDRVHVTPEYAAWYERNFYDTGFINVDTELIVMSDSKDGRVTVDNLEHSVTIASIDTKWLVHAETATTKTCPMCDDSDNPDCPMCFGEGRIPK